MLYVLISIVLFVAILLMVVVLAQEPKGSGISKEFGGAGANQIMGAKNTTNIMEKITWTLIAIVFVGSIGATLLTDAKAPAYISPNVEKAKEQVLPNQLDDAGSQLEQNDVTNPSDPNGDGEVGK
ncbi:MAG: preprotein translocase subunit SecG [Flexibacter sp. CG_4_10_14_3_um_filter_32_15]|nr:MAG: preprotein translocase subunit SecG [Flexibacter sp. CG_4_10_14_3_um_filter_32_15]PJB17203.1 MAG: preprotein translocase subunit SecG [Flavobacteriaceae bacterium CG_4_9_14_3_um_filter_33_16]